LILLIFSGKENDCLNGEGTLVVGCTCRTLQMNDDIKANASILKVLKDNHSVEKQ
jgi:hypothetical protein